MVGYFLSDLCNCAFRRNKNIFIKSVAGCGKLFLQASRATTLCVDSRCGTRLCRLVVCACVWSTTHNCADAASTLCVDSRYRSRALCAVVCACVWNTTDTTRLRFCCLHSRCVDSLLSFWARTEKRDSQRKSLDLRSQGLVNVRNWVNDAQSGRWTHFSCFWCSPTHESTIKLRFQRCRRNLF